MIWIGADLTSLVLNVDQITSYQGCIPTFSLCLDEHTQNVLDGITIDQIRCREILTSVSTCRVWILFYNICRKICPNHQGIKDLNK
ncbi:MAG: hypothetical protein ACFE9Y_13695 [Promethearchaeota archaeon]